MSELDHVINLFVFVIPGFITVWSFRHFSGQKREGEFEYFALSVTWGLILLLLFELIVPHNKVVDSLKNPYAGGLSLLIMGFVLGWLGSLFNKEKWFRKFIDWSKNHHF